MQEFLSEADYVLGETGQTVVYIFPSGKALLSRDAQNVADLTAPFPPADLSPPSPAQGCEAWLNRLLDQGILTPAQVEVGRYDRQTTGLPLVEALMARGWLSPDQMKGLGWVG
ncbi:MAG TPA: hypothetical protein IGR64_16590 [Leptolyngbyaceae cyanobacterium M65_K2018_010]|nr:hypothetical protein [Leptolyngbyaceae cyanobacterium M65_K2018_010]